MNAARFRWWVAGAVSSAAIVALLMPMDVSWGERVARSWSGVAHVTGFAGLAWIWGRAAPESVRGWRLWLALAAAAALVEWIQPVTGRSAEWTDGAYGALGAAVVCASWRFRPGARWALVLVLALVAPAWEISMARMEARAFPELARPGAVWAGRAWNRHRVTVRSTAEHFRIRGLHEGDATDYPGMFRFPVVTDWRHATALATRVFWPAEHPAVLAIRVDDLPGNPPYHDRFQREFTATQGWNQVVIPVSEWSRTAGGRPMDLASIEQWGIFVVAARDFRFFLLESVHLELQKDDP